MDLKPEVKLPCYLRRCTCIYYWYVIKIFSIMLTKENKNKYSVIFKMTFTVELYGTINL